MSTTKDFIQFVSSLKNTIQYSQYKAAKSVNSELVQLYFVLGAAISRKVAAANWGDKVLENISAELQKEMKGLKGFSHQNLKKMKLFYEAYPFMIKHCALLNELTQNNSSKTGSPVENQFTDVASENSSEIGSPLANQLTKNFWNISFTGHVSIFSAIKKPQDRVFYINSTADQGWSKRVLQNHLKNKVHEQIQIKSNFKTAITKIDPNQAIAQFRDEYLLDFINIDDADNERIIEDKIVQNIKDFILHMGKGFSFVGNQYRLEVDGDEFFIDLLFFNRQLQALVAIELKRGKFKPEHLGQLRFYLNVLDEQVKLEHENPSIGIVLCKEKNNAVVEYALRNTAQPMGVAVFKTKQEMPENMRNILPSAGDLKELLS